MNHISALPIGSTLNSYKIESILGQGGFGIVYKAWHEALEEFVVIKEFFPATLAARSQVTVGPHSSSNQEMFDASLKRFFDEGKALVKLKHPNIVRCRDLFRTNGTAYLVMDFEDGLPLSTLLNTMKQQGKTYNQEQLLHFLIPLAEGLAYMHDRGVLHRDIKPDNIFIRRQDGSPVIIDFGAAKQNYAEASQSKAPYTEFYAPIEQIEGESGVTAKPTIDIHAFGGVMYKAITGEVGPKAESRAMALAFGKPDPLKPITTEKYTDFDKQILELVNQSLAFKAEDRPSSMWDIMARLSHEYDDEAANNYETKIQRVNKDAFEQPSEFLYGKMLSKASLSRSYERRSSIVLLGGVGKNLLAHLSHRDVNDNLHITLIGDDLALDEKIYDSVVHISYDRLEQLKLPRGSVGDIVYVVAGLAGRSGEFILDISKKYRSSGFNIVPIVIMPFTFEGQTRINRAEKVKQELEGEFSGVVYFYNEEILQVLSKGTSILEAFSLVNEKILKTITSPVHVTGAEPLNLMSEAKLVPSEVLEANAKPKEALRGRTDNNMSNVSGNVDNNKCKRYHPDGMLKGLCIILFKDVFIILSIMCVWFLLLI